MTREAPYAVEYRLRAAMASFAGDREIVRSIVGIAHTLDKETIAEGVENADVLQTLRKLDVDSAQGFYIGPPAPIV